MNQETITGASPVFKKKFWTKKKIIWTALIIAAVGFISWRIKNSGNPAGKIQTDTVKKQNLKLTVLATGQVVSSTDLGLSFKSGGIVSRVNVKEGSKVSAGTILASLSQSDQVASLTQAQGALAQARANYQKVLAGASSEDVAVTQVALDNAKLSLTNTILQQQVLVDNAYKILLNSGIAAIAGSGNSGVTAATISGAYTSTQQGMYKFSVYTTGGAMRFILEGLETGGGLVSASPQPLGSRGLYLQFSDITPASGNIWTVTIPNTQASGYVANYNAYQAALQTQTSAVATAQNTVASAQAALDLKKAQARPADLAAAEAQILTAQGQLLAAQAAWENTNIRAPSSGTITSVDIKVGEQATPSKVVLVLLDVGSLYIEAQVSEANIATVAPGQKVDVTFDALGPDRHFNAVVQTVNPASTLVSGVVNYKVTASVDNITEINPVRSQTPSASAGQPGADQTSNGIKPGMTANMTILVAEKENVLAIPLRAVISNGKKRVRVIEDSKKKTYHEVEVKTGLEADGGLVEIVDGLKEGQEIVTFVKQ